MADVFISHSSKDKLAADAVCAFLERHGIRCWIAPRDIRAGENWDEAIVRAIDTCRAVVLVFSQNANDSKQVGREVKRAFGRGMPVIPLRLQDAMPGQSLSFYLDSVHWLDAFPSPLDQYFGQLTEVVKTLLGQPVAPAPRKSFRWPRLPSFIKRHRLAVAACGALALLGLLYIGLDVADWQRLQPSLNPADLQSHLNMFPIDPFAAPIRAKLAGEQDWEQVEASRDPVEIAHFVAQYPQSIYTPFLKLRLHRLQQMQSGAYKRALADSSARSLDPTALSQLDCDTLWTARNEIFYALGYCFSTPDALAKFQTADDCPTECATDQVYNAWIRADVISRLETDNIDAIRAMEVKKGCRISKAVPLCPVN